MRLSTSTNVMDRFERKQGVISMEQCLKSCAKAGYTVMDMNFHDMSNKGMPLAQDDWKEWVEHIRDYANDLGLEFSQSHSHFYHFCSPNIQDRDWREELIRRSFIGSSILSIPWMVMHASTYKEEGFSYHKTLEMNIQQFKQWHELAEKYNVGIAIENLYDPLNTFSRTYSSAPEELIELVDMLDSDLVGICWDTGHGHLTDTDQSHSLEMIGGKRLKAVHINDNNKLTDQHLLPFYGTIEWEPIMKALKKINYKGDFTFEITPFLDRVPPTARKTGLEHTVEVGRYLMGLTEKL